MKVSWRDTVLISQFDFLERGFVEIIELVVCYSEGQFGMRPRIHSRKAEIVPERQRRAWRG